MKNVEKAETPKSEISILPPRPFRASGKVAQTAFRPARWEGKSCIPTVNQTFADSRILKFRTFRVAPLGSVNPSPLGDRDATLGLCKMQSLEVTRSGTASITSCGSRNVGRDDGQRARDHVHILIGIPPHVSVSRAVQYLKGKSSHKFLSEYQSLRKRYWGQHLWGRGYWVATGGNVTDEVWKKYIEDQKPEVPADHFNVV